jgi:hypothetical protein
MKNRIEFYSALNEVFPGYQEIVPRVSSEIGTTKSASEWADEMWQGYQRDGAFREGFDRTANGGGVLVA